MNIFDLFYEGRKEGKALKGVNYLFILSLIIFSFSLVSADEFGYNYLTSGDNLNPSLITTSTATSGNLTNFTSLVDTPASYAGEGTNCVVVNAGETALEFGACAAGGGDNASWNQSGADLLYAGIEWDYNQSDATFAMWNSTWDNRGLISDIVQDNASWNQSGADGLYAPNTTEGIQVLINNTGVYSTFNSTYDSYIEGNASFNQTLTDELYYNISNPLNFLNFTNFNTSQFEQSGDTVSINVTWFSNLFDSLFGGKTTDDLTEGSTNLYDNKSWNQSGADLLYADISVTGDNASWNQSGADLLYAPNTTEGIQVLINDTGVYSTYNVTYDGHVQDNESWNKSYADTLYADISVTGDNASWNQSGADLLYADISVTGDNASWNQSGADLLYAGIEWGYNQSDATFAMWNSTWDNRGLISDIVQDNVSWNQSGADLLYADISVTGDNASWNQSGADLLYMDINQAIPTIWDAVFNATGDGRWSGGSMDYTNIAMTNESNQFSGNTTYTSGNSLLVGLNEWFGRYVAIPSIGIKFDGASTSICVTNSSGDCIFGVDVINGEVNIENDLNIGKNLYVEENGNFDGNLSSPNWNNESHQLLTFRNANIAVDKYLQYEGILLGSKQFRTRCSGSMVYMDTREFLSATPAPDAIWNFSIRIDDVNSGFQIQHTNILSVADTHTYITAEAGEYTFEKDIWLSAYADEINGTFAYKNFGLNLEIIYDENDCL